MNRKCVACKSSLADNCYVKDNGTTTLSFLELIIKNKDLKKKHHELNASYCPTCGHVELWIDLEK